MKGLKIKRLLSLVVILVMMSSCISQKNSTKQATLEAKIIKEGIVGQKIGFIDKTGQAKLLVSTEVVNKAIGRLIRVPSTDDREIVMYSNSRIFSKNGVNYLQSVAKGGVKTNTLLKNIDGELYIAGISCTSKNCVDNNGCMPRESGTSCTPCGDSDNCIKTAYR